MTDWLANAAGIQAATIPTDFFSQLLAAAQRFDDQSAESLLQAFNQHFEGNNASQAFSTFIEELDPATKAKVEQQWRQLKDKLAGQLPAEIKALFIPLEQCQGEQALPLVSLAPQGQWQAGQFKLGLELSSALEVEVLAQDAAETALGDKLPVGKCLQRLGLDGKLAASLGGQLPLSFGSLGLNASGQGQVELDSFYLAPKDASLGQSLVEIGRGWTSPLDLGQLLAAMAAPLPLRRLQLSFDAELALGAELKVGKSLTRRLETLGGQALDSPQKVDAELAATVGLSLKDKGSFELELQRDTPSSLWVRLYKRRDKSRSSLLQLGADIQLKGLTDNLRQLVDRALPDMSAFDAELKDFKWPGKLLQDKLALPDDSLFAPLIEQLLAAPSAQSLPLAQQLKNLIKEQLAHLVDEKLPLWQQDDAQLGQRLLLELGQALGLDSKGQGQLDELLASPLEKGIGKVKEALADKLQGLKDKGAADLDALLKPLAAVDADIQATKDAIQQGLAQALAPIETFLGRYSQFRNRILKVVADDLQERVGLQWLASSEQGQSRESRFSCRILKDSPQSRALYQALWQRDLSRLPALLAAALANKSVDKVDGSYSALAQHKSQTTVTLNLLGFGASWSSQLLNLAKVERSLDGQILACHSQAEVDKVHGLLGERKSAALVMDTDLKAMLAGTLLPAPLKLQFSLSDDNLTAQELALYFKGMEQLGLCQSGAGAQALQALGADSDKGANKADLSTSLAFTAGQWRCLLAGENQGEALVETLLDIYEQSLAQSHSQDQEAVARRPALQQAKGLDRQAWYRALAKQPNSRAGAEWQLDRTLNGVATGLQHQVQRLWELGRAVLALAEGYQAMTGHWQHLAALLREDGASDRDIKAATQALNAALLEGITPSLKAGSVLFDTQNRIPWPTLALYQALAVLAGRQPPMNLVTQLALTRKGQDYQYLIG